MGIVFSEGHHPVDHVLFALIEVRVHHGNGIVLQHGEAVVDDRADIRVYVLRYELILSLRVAFPGRKVAAYMVRCVVSI